MPADAVRRATLTLRPAEGSVQTREACFTSLIMRRTYEGGYAQPDTSCVIDPNRVPGFWEALHKIVAQRHGAERILDGALWEVTWIDGNAKGQARGVCVSDAHVGTQPSDNRYAQLLSLFEELSR